MINGGNLENNLKKKYIEYWEEFKSDLSTNKTANLSMESICKNYAFMQGFDSMVSNTVPYYDVHVDELGTLYRGVGINEPFDLSKVSRMIPHPKYVKKHNRMNPPGESFMYLSVIPQRKGKSDEIEKNFIMKTIEAELRAKSGDYYTLSKVEFNNDKKIYSMIGDPKIPFDLNYLAKQTLKKETDINKLHSLFYFNMFNEDEIFKPVDNNDPEIRKQEYAPFQFLARYLKNKGYDGIKYRSTVHKKGSNLVIFDSSDAKILESSMKRIYL